MCSPKALERSSSDFPASLQPSPAPNYPGVQLWGSHGVLGLGLLGSDQGQRLLVKPCQKSQVLTGQSCEDSPGRRLCVGVDEGTALLPDS